MDHEHPMVGADVRQRTEAEIRIDEAFHRAKLGLPLTDHQVRIVQFLDNGFGCHACGDAPIA